MPCCLLVLLGLDEEEFERVVEVGGQFEVEDVLPGVIGVEVIVIDHDEFVAFAWSSLSVDDEV